MRIFQIVPSIAYGDAIGNDTLAIHKILSDSGYKTGIYADGIDPRLPKKTAFPVSCLPRLTSDDIIIYHGATGSDLNYTVPTYGGRKLMIYHNITPPHFFAPYSSSIKRDLDNGLCGIRYLSDKVDYCIADSDFNKQDLLQMGYTCPIDVCPILIPFSDYDKTPSKSVINRYRSDNVTNLLFVGRFAPNKKQEDVIAAFYYYHKHYNNNSRLFLVGSSNVTPLYYEHLCRYIKELGLEQSVIIPGHIKFEELLAYYSIADAFVCMSEHEGFCVPLVEAMYFNVPIVAYRSTAIPYTMGNQGLLLESKEPEYVAAVIDRLITDATLRNHIVQLQRNILQEYEYANVRKKFVSLLDSFIHSSQ